MHWLLLFLAGLFEIFFAVSLKYTEGFTKLKPSVAFFVFSILSVACLSAALNKIPIGTAYAVWTGIGAIGTAVVGIILFNEPISMMRIFFMTTLIVSIIGLKIS